MMPPMRWLLIVGVFASGCAYHAPDAPTPIPAIAETVPYTLSLGANSGMGADAGHATITAKVQNVKGAPMAGIVVTFTTDVGTLSANPVATAANGQAVTTITAAGTAAISASAGTLTTHTQVVSQPVSTVPAPTPTPNPQPNPNPAPTPTGPLSVTVTTDGAVTIGTQTIFSANVKNGPAVSFAWNFGDGATFNGQSPTTAHTYTATGTGVATLRITDALNRSASASTAVTVNAPAPTPTPAPAPPPSATVTATLNCVAGNHSGTETFCNVTASDGDGKPVTSQIATDGVAWEWGDGTGVGHLGVLSHHQYTQAGTYIVFVTVDHGTARTTTSKSVVIP